MQTVQQIVPISHFRTNQDSVLQLMDKQPVILAQRSKPRAVLVSVDDWNSTAQELQRLQHLELCDKVSAEMDTDTTTVTVLTGDELVELFNG